MVIIISNTLLEGDTLLTSDQDVIAQEGLLDVSSPVPDGWRVLVGRSTGYSKVWRVAYRYEILEDQVKGRVIG